MEDGSSLKVFPYSSSEQSSTDTYAHSPNRNNVTRTLKKNLPQGKVLNKVENNQTTMKLQTNQLDETPLIKREWCYVGKPAEYLIAACKCGNVDIEWSEYQGHCWCNKCLVDFIPEDNGVFDGPISLNICNLLHISFDRFNVKTGIIDKMDLRTGKYESENN